LVFGGEAVKIVEPMIEEDDLEVEIAALERRLVLTL